MECESELKRTNIEYENIKKKLIEDKTHYDSVLKWKDIDCESKITNCNNDLNYCTEARNNNSKQIDELELENDELKKKIESKNKNSNNSQSTQNTLVIICLLIILGLLGFGIYLYFKKR